MESTENFGEFFKERKIRRRIRLTRGEIKRYSNNVNCMSNELRENLQGGEYAVANPFFACILLLLC